MTLHVFADNINLDIELLRKQTMATASTSRKIVEPLYRVDDKRIYLVATNAIAFTDYVHRASFNATYFATPSKQSAQAANVDALAREQIDNAELIIKEMQDTASNHSNETHHEFLLVAGDEKYVAVVKQLRELGFWVAVAFWSSAAAALKDSCSHFSSLDLHLDALRIDSSAQNDARTD